MTIAKVTLLPSGACTVPVQVSVPPDEPQFDEFIVVLIVVEAACVPDKAACTVTDCTLLVVSDLVFRMPWRTGPPVPIGNATVTETDTSGGGVDGCGLL